jgi:hypothetical protein
MEEEADASGKEKTTETTQKIQVIVLEFTSSPF